MMIRHCLLNGNAYAVIQWGRDGFPAALHPYPPQSVNVEQTGEHNWRYCITDAYTGNTRNYLPWKYFTFVTPRMTALWGAHL